MFARGAGRAGYDAGSWIAEAASWEKARRVVAKVTSTANEASVNTFMHSGALCRVLFYAGSPEWSERRERLNGSSRKESFIVAFTVLEIVLGIVWLLWLGVRWLWGLL